MGPGSLLLLLSGCRAQGIDLQARVAPGVANAVVVEWSAAVPVDRARIEHGPTEALGERLSIDDSGRALLLGLAEDEDVHLRLVVESDGRELRSEERVVHTGVLPADMPVLSTEGDGDLDGGLLVMSHVQSPGAAMVVDSEGRVLWWWSLTEDLRISRACLSRDRQSMLILPVNHLGEQDHGLVRVGLDGVELERIEVDDAHHDMVELPDGGFAFLVHDRREIEGVGEILGDKLVERAPDGSQREIWSTWDDFPYDPEAHVLSGPTYTHANAIDYLEDQDAFLVGLLGLSALVKIDRATGEVLWILGSAQSDWHDPDGDGQILDHQHQFDRVDGGLLVFENGPPNRASSRALELHLDEASGIASEVGSYWPEPELYTYSMGSVQRLDSGRDIVAFSVNGVIDQVEPDGSRAWRLESSVGGAFGFVEWVDGLYPSSP